MLQTQWNQVMTKEFWSDFSKLPSDATQRAKRAIDRMLQDPWAQELHPEKIQAAETGVHSCRADENYRIIWKHIKPNDIVFLLIDKHDAAYRRASRKTFTLKDGVVKIMDIVEVGAEPAEALMAQKSSSSGKQIGKLFIAYTDKEILSWEIPDDLLPNLRALDNVDELAQFENSDVLSEAVFDKLLTVALNIIERPVVPDEKLSESISKFQGGDDLCRFVDSDEFKRVLDGTLEEWMLFLAPHQRVLTFREYNGPARVRGIAGSGKTVIALHRAKFLAQKISGTGKKVLFLTFGNRLPGVITHLFGNLSGQDEKITGAFECITIHQLCYRLAKKAEVILTYDEKLCTSALSSAIEKCKSNFNAPSLFGHSTQFFQDEIKYAIKGRGIDTLGKYLKLDRTGRGTALNPSERQAMFAVYEEYQKQLKAAGKFDFEDYIIEAFKAVNAGKARNLPYVNIIVDEIQDLSEITMRLVRALIPGGQNDLFLVGDGMQRIYPGGYSLPAIGIEIGGRSSLLRKNYRNTQQILRVAHAMIQNVQMDDMDADRTSATEPELSIRTDALPTKKNFITLEEELNWVSVEIDRLLNNKRCKQGDIAILYRHTTPYKEQISKLISKLHSIVEITKDPANYFGDTLKYTTFHSGKGLEFKVVFIVGATDGQSVPQDDWTLQGVELEEYLNRERRLLYVAMTRARDLLYITSARGQESRFLSTVPKDYWQ